MGSSLVFSDSKVHLGFFIKRHSKKAKDYIILTV